MITIVMIITIIIIIAIIIINIIIAMVGPSNAGNRLPRGLIEADGLLLIAIHNLAIIDGSYYE